MLALVASLKNSVAFADRTKLPVAVEVCQLMVRSEALGLYRRMSVPPVPPSAEA